MVSFDSDYSGEGGAHFFSFLGQLWYLCRVALMFEDTANCFHAQYLDAEGYAVAALVIGGTLVELQMVVECSQGEFGRAGKARAVKKIGRAEIGGTV